MKTHFVHGITSGILATLAGIAYQYIYQNSLFLDYSSVINTGAIAGASFFGCMLMAFGYWIAERTKKQYAKGGINILILLFTFASIIGPLGMTLPLEVVFPEMFVGLAIPMHFFPALVFFGIDPFFKLKTKNLNYE